MYFARLQEPTVSHSLGFCLPAMGSGVSVQGENPNQKGHRICEIQKGSRVEADIENSELSLRGKGKIRSLLNWVQEECAA